MGEMVKQDEESRMSKKALEREVRLLRSDIQTRKSLPESNVSPELYARVESDVINAYQYIRHYELKLDRAGDEIIPVVRDIQNAVFYPISDDARHKIIKQKAIELAGLSAGWQNAYVEMTTALGTTDIPIEEDKMMHFLSDLQTAMRSYTGGKSIEPLIAFFSKYPTAAAMLALRPEKGRPEGLEPTTMWIGRRLYELKRGDEKRTYQKLAIEVLLPELANSTLNSVDRENCRVIITTYDAKGLGNIVSRWKATYREPFLNNS